MRWLIPLLLLAGCEFPVAPWGFVTTCTGRDTVWVVVETKWERTHVAQCRLLPCAAGDSVFYVNYTDCQYRLLPEGRPIAPCRR